MRNSFNPSRLCTALLAAVAIQWAPMAAATPAPASVRPVVHPYNRLSVTAMGQFGADSTSLNAQDVTLPLLARLDVPVQASAPWSVATVSMGNDGLRTVPDAPPPAVTPSFASSRLPKSSPWTGMVATTMLVAFFLSRRAQ